MDQQQYESTVLGLVFFWQHTAPDVDVESILNEVGIFDDVLTLLKKENTIKSLLEHQEYLKSIGISPRLDNE